MTGTCPHCGVTVRLFVVVHDGPGRLRTAWHRPGDPRIYSWRPSGACEGSRRPPAGERPAA